MRSLLVLTAVFLFQLYEASGDAKLENGTDENSRLSFVEGILCNGLNVEETVICNVIIKNFKTLIHKSHSFETQILQSSENTTHGIVIINPVTIHELELKSRQNDLIAQLMIAKERETEAKVRLVFALQREEEVKSKLEELQILTQNEIVESRNLQNSTDTKLMQTRQQTDRLNAKILLATASESRLQSTLEMLNKSLSTCEQDLSEKTSQFNAASIEVMKLKTRMNIIQEHANESNYKLTECQRHNMNEPLMILTKQLQLIQDTLNEFRSLEYNARNYSQELRNSLKECTQHLKNITTEHANIEILQEQNGTEEALNSSAHKDAIPGATILSTGIYYFHNVPSTWHDARNFCISKGMDLVAIESDEENSAIAEHAKHLGGPLAHWSHTSGCFSAESNEFVWLSTKQPLNFFKWNARENSTINQTENSCIQMYINGGGKWFSLNINHEFEAAVCEFFVTEEK